MSAYYTNGKPKLIGKSSNIEYDVLEGQCINFDNNGKKQLVATYKKGWLTGLAYEYFPTGKLNCVKEYDGRGNFKINACFYSTGNALVPTVMDIT